MSCGCGCGSCGMGDLGFTIIPRFQGGLRGLGEIRAGSEIAVGFKYTTLSLDLPDFDQLAQTITGCLYGTGAFSNVSVEPSLGVFSNYLTVKATISTSFNQAEDIGGLIEGRIRECYPDFAQFLQSRDKVAVYKVPAAPNQPMATVPVPPGTPGGPPASVQSLTDSLFSSLGLGGGSSMSGTSLSKLIIPILLAVVVAKAFK